MKIRTPKLIVIILALRVAARSLRHCNYHSSMHRSRWKSIHTPCGKTSASRCNIRSSNGERRSSAKTGGGRYMLHVAPPRSSQYFKSTYVLRSALYSSLAKIEHSPADSNGSFTGKTRHSTNYGCVFRYIFEL